MRPNTSVLGRLAACLVSLALFMAACTPPPATPDAVALAQSTEQSAAGTVAAATSDAARVATGVAATLTAQPTATRTHTPAPTDTPVPTETPTSTDTPEPTETRTPKPSPTITNTPRPTLPPVSPTPSPAPTSASIYGWANGPEGYVTDIECTIGGAPCTGVMPPGDITFEFVLVSFELTPLTLFEKYGLSVERDGANVADMFMFVDAGLLAPDTGVWFGASRRFTTPGRYVVRSSGCLTTVPAPCAWNTMEGTTVTFTIQ
jgi:hypothetical protein